MPEVRRAFSEELERLRLDVVRLGALALEAIHRGSEALLTYDLSAVDDTVAHDGQLDHLSDSIEERIYRLLATQAPVASDLRTMVTMLRVTSNASVTTWSTSPRPPAACRRSRSIHESSGSSTACTTRRRPSSSLRSMPSPSVTPHRFLICRQWTM